MEPIKLTNEPRTIDCTPTWAGLMPLLWETAAKGVPEARAELMRLARIVDDLNAERQAELPEDLINGVLNQIKNDVQGGDLTAVAELLEFLPVNRLSQYLPEAEVPEVQS